MLVSLLNHMPVAKLGKTNFAVRNSTETSWDASIRSEEIFGNNFNVFRNDSNLSLSNKKSGGGVLRFIHSDFTSEQIETNTHKEFEHVWFKVIFARKCTSFAPCISRPKMPISILSFYPI